MKLFVFFSLLLAGLSLADIPEIPDLDDFDAIKERCDTKGGAGVYDKVKSARDETAKCIGGLIDVDKAKAEVEEAKKTGSMDEVFGKYCNKRPQLKECLKKTYDAVEPCLEENEKQAINTTANILSQIGDFVCFKDGDRIAMFVAEGGVECLQSRSEQIKNCFNKTIKFDPTKLSPNAVPNLTFDKKKCDDFKTIQECVVADLEDNCEDSTPANIVDAMFRFVKKIACKDIKRKRSISLSLKRHIRSAVEKMHKSIQFDMEKKIKAICQKNGGEDSYNKLMVTLNDIRLCFNQYQLFVTPLNIFKTALDNCTKSARTALKNCLSEPEKYYPDMALEEFESLTDFIYLNANNLTDPASHVEIAQCFKSLGQSEIQKQLLSCYGDFTKDDFFTIPPRAELCLKKFEFDSCFKNKILNACIPDIKITTFLDELIAAAERPCRK